VTARTMLNERTPTADLDRDTRGGVRLRRGGLGGRPERTFRTLFGDGMGDLQHCPISGNSSFPKNVPLTVFAIIAHSPCPFSG